MGRGDNSLSMGAITALVVFVLLIGGIGGIYLTNKYDFLAQKVDDATNYESIKKVEDTCRAMIASYTADKLRYETYAASDSAEKQNWAEQAKIRANTTAAKYNEYFLKNSFIWKDNIPEDIAKELPYIE